MESPRQLPSPAMSQYHIDRVPVSDCHWRRDHEQENPLSLYP